MSEENELLLLLKDAVALLLDLDPSVGVDDERYQSVVRRLEQKIIDLG